MHVLDLKSQIAFKCLVALLPTPPKRGVKMAKLPPACAVDQLFMDFEVKTTTWLQIILLTSRLTLTLLCTMLFIICLCTLFIHEQVPSNIV